MPVAAVLAIRLSARANRDAPRCWAVVPLTGLGRYSARDNSKDSATAYRPYFPG
jgi:hypothetical protein